MKIIAILAMLVLPAAMFAQNPRAAVGGEASLWAGGEFTSLNPDYSCSSNEPWRCAHQAMGPTAFFDFNVKSKWGVEGEARWLNWNQVGGETLSNYLGGGRYRVARLGRASVWLKMLVGGGWIQTPYYPQAGSLKGSYFAYVPGITGQYRLTSRLSLRGDYEYEIWPSFAGPPTNGVLHDNGLTPNGFSAGVTYRIFGH